MDQPTQPGGLRQKQKAETRERVLSAARKLFEAQGYSAVTVRMISDEAGVAVGSVFTAFESKDDLLVEIICEDFETLTPLVLARLSLSAAQPLPERIVSALEPAFAYDLAHIGKLRETMANSWTRTPAQEARTRASIAPVILAFRDAISEAKKQGKVWAEADPAVLADVIAHLYYTNYRRVVFDGWGLAEVTAALLAQLKQLLR